MADPRRAKLTGTPAWTGGELFNGFVSIALALPSNSGGDFPTVYLGAGQRRCQLPIWTRVRVKDGVFDPEAKLFFNADIDPPNTRYFAYWFAYPKFRVSPLVGNPSAFTVTADPYAITIPTLTDPTAPTTAPVPVDED